VPELFPNYLMCADHVWSMCRGVILFLKVISCLKYGSHVLARDQDVVYQSYTVVHNLFS
jgi:hypothetical protein